ncbi:FMN-binding glutamate synthase family protein [Sulfitobacter sp. M57]|uniref:FMN-binding glutamate synthase family protein n=1 Tax=unclassified Sulfitobacter TaxID=196795 RepID=UPI0023E1C2A2|nr:MULTISPECIES: FMN-binding glutamate synthase family protein [unclassified Sulfitobacter]MDF3415144.1 FMN-binding glutamate synthase family protein [Sulfitobacter sp. KE5]MDF3422625.1 FMN-binding glutamate synthase family protein [Sulfitobacter sp. KE43]MDF3433690.1 FMN-binding glutamate synthase family protein [Sulfitobacter sp. KE42]MDF3459330.1 FMN-binding glutamate synthase family protein [Sulfitobacter sp. S74]MDF3463229.1 FMN-binding glutamate synthase family protein [Sulfitobacter sp.
MPDLGSVTRFTTFALVGVLTLVSFVLIFLWSLWFALPFALFAALTGMGIYDVTQTRHSILRNYPVLGHMRFFFEGIRPEIRQYLIESDQDEEPFSRDSRSLVYQRAKGEEDARPFGTRMRVYDAGYSWVTHSVAPVHITDSDFRTTIGGSQCRQPYSASLYNISAMSFGSLSANAIQALNTGAKLGGFAHDTGEGSVSRYHKAGGGDLIYQLASGYFGSRASDGTFDPEKFRETASLEQIKMIELKLSQGAKPGHGGMLPASKISPEIAEARGVPMGKDCVSPAAHSAFSTPIEMMEFIGQLRELSGGKPVGFKLCIGHRREFMCMVKAMLETGITPDFIVVDGTEGGTGAAPVEFSNHIGMPMIEGLTFVHNTLRGAGLRKEIKIGAAGKVVSAFDIARALALGADWCNSARGYMFAIGCIQAQACHTNHCPVGVATQDKTRMRALDVGHKSQRVARFHRNTMEALGEMTGAAGLHHPSDFLPHHMMLRQGDKSMVEAKDVYGYLPEGYLLDGDAADINGNKNRWSRARADTFASVDGL